MWRDAVGTVHARAGDSARIVSLVPSITELICDLGLTGQLVGRTGFCVHPRLALKRIPKLGGTKDVNLAKLRALAPSHVVLNIDENERPTAVALAQFVPHLIVTHPLGPLDNPPLYRLIGGIFGREQAAEALCANFQRACEALAQAARDWPRQRVLYLIWKDPWMTVARDTYISRTLALAGWDTVPATATARYPALTLDEITALQADLVLLSSEPYRFRARHVAALRALPAMREKTALLIDGEMTSWYGSRAIEGMDYLRRLRRKLSGQDAADNGFGQMG